VVGRVGGVYLDPGREQAVVLIRRLRQRAAALVSTALSFAADI
jgi:hypothetical protein